MAKTVALGRRSLIVGLLVGALSFADHSSWACSANDSFAEPVLSDESYIMTGVQEKMQSKTQTAASQKQQQRLDEFMNMSTEEKQQIIMDLQQKSEHDAAALEQSQWGFLKNIINIDKFFDSGADAGGSKKEGKASLSQKKEEKVQNAGSQAQTTAAQNEQQKDKEQKSEEKESEAKQEGGEKESAEGADKAEQEASEAKQLNQNSQQQSSLEKSREELELGKKAAEKRREVLEKKKAALRAKRQALAQKKKHIAETTKSRQQQAKDRKHAEAQAAFEARDKELQNKEQVLIEEVKQQREKATHGFEESKKNLTKQEELSSEKHKAQAVAREKELSARREARRQRAIHEGQAAAQQRKQRKDALEVRRFIRQNKINFLSALVTPPEGENKFFVTKDDMRWFTKPERFYIVQFMNTKKGPLVQLYKAFNVMSLRRAFLKFRGFIRQDYIRDNKSDRQYGLIANDKLLFSTSGIKKFINDRNDTFLTSTERFSSGGEQFTNDTIAKYFIGFGLQRGIIKMPTSLYDAEANQYQILSIEKGATNSTTEKVGEDRKRAIKMFKNVTGSQQDGKLAVLVDPSGRAIKFSQKNKQELFSDLADFVQSNGDFTTPVMREDLAGFDLLPPGQRPESRYSESTNPRRQSRDRAPLPVVGDLHRRHQPPKQVSADSLDGGEQTPSESAGSTDQSAQMSQSVLPMHIRRIKHQNRNLRKKISEEEKRLEGTQGGDDGHRKKQYSKYGERIVNLLEHAYEGQGKKLNNTYRFGVLARDQKTKEYRQIADVSSNNMKMALKRLSQLIIKEIVDKRTGEMFMVYAETGPLFCSVPSMAFQCREMSGYAVTHGLYSPDRALFHDDKANKDQYHLLQRAKGSPQVRLRPIGHNLSRAKELFKKASKNKKMIVALMGSDGKLIQQTVTNPKKQGDARYGMLYSSIGLYQTLRSPNHFGRPIKNEKAAGLH